MGVRLGMCVASLDRLVKRLEDLGMRKQRYIVYLNLIFNTFPDDLITNLRGLRFRTFSDHNSFCGQ